MTRKLIQLFYTLLAHIFYPQKTELLQLSPTFARGYILAQKVLNLNGCRRIPWPVHLTSKVYGNITVGKITTPGMSPNIYVNGLNGVVFGDNVYIGPGAKIISANHDERDYRRHIPGKPVRIGNNVWIGANAVILPEVTIGDNVIVGAGAVVTADVPPDVIVAGNPARVIREKAPYGSDEVAHGE